MLDRQTWIDGIAIIYSIKIASLNINGIEFSGNFSCINNLCRCQCSSSFKKCENREKCVKVNILRENWKNYRNT